MAAANSSCWITGSTALLNYVRQYMTLYDNLGATSLIHGVSLRCTSFSSGTHLLQTTLRQDGHLKNLREMRRPPLASALLQRPVTGTPSSLYGWQSKAAKDENGLEEFGNSLDREVVAVDSKSAESGMYTT